MNSHDYAEVFRDTCMAGPSHQLMQILDDYEKSRGNSSIYDYWHDQLTIITVVFVLMATAEITIYITFFYHLFRHDNNETLGRLIGADDIKHRNKQNAITFFGQFCSFLFELSIGILSIFAINGEAPFFVVSILKVIGFTSISLVEVLVSGNLRPRIFNP